MNAPPVTHLSEQASTTECQAPPSGNTTMRKWGPALEELSDYETDGKHAAPPFLIKWKV